MPFDLRLHYVPRGGGIGWEMEGPAWLSRAPLPFDKARIRELVDESHCRDRYAPISAEELMAWHRQVWDDQPLDELSEHTRRAYDSFISHVGKAPPSTMYLLCWYEWESGMN